MGVKSPSIEQTKVNIKNVAARASRGAREAMERGAIKIKDRAKEYAPRLHNPEAKSGLSGEGFLEKAIKYERVKALGSGRMEFDVFVDEDAEAYGGKKVGDYSTIMHETDYEPGEKSKAKGTNAGPKYMERAFLELRREITKDVEANIEKGIGH